MNRQQLQSIQAPLKARYREDASAAHLTLSATGALDPHAIACSVAAGRAIATAVSSASSASADAVTAGLHPATGGDGSHVCSGDMLLQALVACAGVTLRAVATALEIPVAGTVHAEGDLDVRGTLGVDKHVPVGFRAIRLRFALETRASDDQLQRLLELTERYCVVYQTLARGTPTTTHLHRTDPRPTATR